MPNFMDDVAAIGDADTIKKSHTCEESWAHLRICFAFIGKLKKQLFNKKTVELGQ